MKLASYMKQHDLDDVAMAALIGSCTANQVKKWKYEERTPKLHDVIAIETVTKGAVTARDFLPTSDLSASDSPLPGARPRAP